MPTTFRIPFLLAIGLAVYLIIGAIGNGTSVTKLPGDASMATLVDREIVKLDIVTRDGSLRKVDDYDEDEPIIEPVTASEPTMSVNTGHDIDFQIFVCAPRRLPAVLLIALFTPIAVGWGMTGRFWKSGAVPSSRAACRRFFLTTPAIVLTLWFAGSFV